MVCQAGFKPPSNAAATTVESLENPSNVPRTQRLLKLESRHRASVTESLIINPAFKLAAVLGHFAGGRVGDKDTVGV